MPSPWASLTATVRPVQAGMFENNARVLALLRTLEKQNDGLGWH
jgi:hypothetical protein